MTCRRWIADEVDLARHRAALLGNHAAHLSRVLRARVGEEFDLVLGAGQDAEVRRGRVASIQDERVEFELGAAVPSVAPVIQINLFLAIFKFDRMEWAMEKAVELGVSHIMPVVAQRTGKHLAASAAKRRQRWSRIVRQAAQQSRRSYVPVVEPEIPLQAAIDRSTGARIVLAETEHQLSLRAVLDSLDDLSTLHLAVGPEGGWTAKELKMFAQAGWRSASLGKNILRAETAAIAAVAIATSQGEQSTHVRARTQP